MMETVKEGRHREVVLVHTVDWVSDQYQRMSWARQLTMMEEGFVEGMVNPLANAQDEPIGP
jgi:hypothetical protein